jgi:hypothetical protein
MELASCWFEPGHTVRPGDNLDADADADAVQPAAEGAGADRTVVELAAGMQPREPGLDQTWLRLIDRVAGPSRVGNTPASTVRCARSTALWTAQQSALRAMLL